MIEGLGGDFRFSHNVSRNGRNTEKMFYIGRPVQSHNLTLKKVDFFFFSFLFVERSLDVVHKRCILNRLSEKWLKVSSCRPQLQGVAYDVITS